MHRWPIALFVCVAAGPAQASDFAGHPEGPTLFGHPVNVPPPLTDAEIAKRRESFEQHLRDNDLVYTGDRVLPRALVEAGGPGPQHDHDGTWHDEPHYATIFLNFFGGMLTSGTNASEMESGCVGAAGVDYPGYSGSEPDALAIIQVFENAMEPYAVRVAYDDYPPQHLPYSMVMMGGTPAVVGQDAGTLGVSCSTDCGDLWWRDTTLAFTEQSGNPTTLANTALQEAAHAFGLDHIDGENHIMYPLATFGTKVWATECTSYNTSTGGTGCEHIHEIFCPEGAQNDDAELLAFFGPNAPDVEAPTVAITAPAPDTMLPSGGATTVTAEVSDDHLGFGWRLRVVPPEGEEAILNAYELETSWDFNLAGFPDGAYQVFVEAVDHDGNEGSDMITLYVGVEPPTPGEDETGPAGSGSDDTAVGSSDDDVGVGSSDDDADDDGSGSTTPLMDDGGDKGCECRADARGRAGAWLLLALVPAFRRRARKRL